MRPFHILVASAVLGLGLAGTAYADDPRVPTTGGAQGEIVPNALPGGGPAHVRVPEGHIIAPTGVTPQSAEGLSQPRNSLSGATGPIGEAQPHADVTGSPGAVPNSAEGALGIPSVR